MYEPTGAPATMTRARQLAALPALFLVLVALSVGPVGRALAFQEPDVTAEQVFGTIRSGNQLIAGVAITVTDAEGNVIAEIVTGDDGAWRVDVPGPGDYVATIDPATLPAGIVLTDPTATSVELSVEEGRQRAALFPVSGAQAETDAEEGTDAVPEAAGPSKQNRFERIAQSTVNGIKFGLIIAMAAIGLSLIFGTTGLINFAHGEFVTFGAVVAWFLNDEGPRLQLIAAGLLAVAITGAFGGALELGLWRPLRRRKLGTFQKFVITIGLALMLRHIILIWFGSRSRPYRDYTIQDQWEIGPIAITPRDLTIIVLSILLLVGVATLLQRTRIGKAMRAVSDNFDLAEASGIDVQRVILFVWVMGAGLAAVGGIFLGATETVNWQMGFRLLLLMFAAVILGGLGTAYGAMVGGIVVGLVTEISTVWVSPEIKLVFALAALILVLLVRPQGILGSRERVG